MATCFARPTPSQVRTNIEDLFSANVLGGAPVIPESNEWYIVNNDTAAMELFYSVAAMQWKEQDDTQNCCDSLIKRSAVVGLYPKAASFASGYVMITGAVGVLIPSNLTAQFNSYTFNIDPYAVNPTKIDASGGAIVLMNSVLPGSIVNSSISQNASGTITTLSLGLDSAAKVSGVFCGGADAETCEQFRTRVLDRRQYKPVADYAWAVAKALEYPCVTRVCRRDCDGCCPTGYLNLYVFMDNSFYNGIPPASVISAFNTWMYGNPAGVGLGKLPIGTFGAAYSMTASPININISGTQCSTTDQLAEIKRQITALFQNICPGSKFCRRWLDAIIIGLQPTACDYTVSVTSTAPGITIDCNGEAIADCDYLMTLGTLDVS